MSTVYKGFNTVSKNVPSFTLTDTEIVKQDILNHFMTRKGERVMLPNFGSKIHDYLMDPFDDITVDAILEDAKTVISSDPRVELIDMNVIELDHTLRLEIQLMFLPFENAETLFVDFKRADREAF